MTARNRFRNVIASTGSAGTDGQIPCALRAGELAPARLLNVLEVS